MMRDRGVRRFGGLTTLIVGALLAGTTFAAPVHLVAERDTPSTPGQDLFLLSFPSLADMVASTNLVQQAIAIPLSNSFSIGGFEIEAEPPVSHVPEPGTLALLGLGLVGLAAARRRHR
jgi:hypothetical protein